MHPFTTNKTKQESEVNLREGNTYFVAKNWVIDLLTFVELEGFDGDD